MLIAQSSPYVQLPDSTQQPWTGFTTVIYIIHDAWRLGLNGDYIITDRELHVTSSTLAVGISPANKLY
jgi:hypothetical protein